MKCPNCGAQMGLEHKFCPYCGSPNPFAQKHQKDMEHYQREYASTQEDVLSNTAMLRRHGGQLIILAIVLVLMVVAIILNAFAWDIAYGIRQKASKRTLAQDAATLEEYLQEGEYGKFLGHYDAIDFYDANLGYDAVRGAANSYASIVGYCWVLRNLPEYNARYDWLPNNSSYIAESLIRLYTLEREYTYNHDVYFAEDKMVYIDDIRDRVRAMALTYFRFTEEEISEIPNMSKKRIAEILEERFSDEEE